MDVNFSYYYIRSIGINIPHWIKFLSKGGYEIINVQVYVVWTGFGTYLAVSKIISLIQLWYKKRNMM